MQIISFELSLFLCSSFVIKNIVFLNFIQKHLEIGWKILKEFLFRDSKQSFIWVSIAIDYWNQEEIFEIINVSLKVFEPVILMEEVLFPVFE